MRPAAWTTRDVARRANVSTRTVQRWIESGGLPARRVGRTLRVEPAEFEAWWAAQATRPAQQSAPERRVVPAPVEGYGPWPHPRRSACATSPDNCHPLAPTSAPDRAPPGEKNSSTEIDVDSRPTTHPTLTDLERRRRTSRLRTALKRPGVWVTGPLTRRKLYPPTRRTH